MKIGVIGNGYVGGAVAKGLAKLGDDVAIWDRDHSRSTHTLDETCGADFVFLCVPTPTTRSGRQDMYAVSEMTRVVSELNLNAIIMMKSTVLPGTCERMSSLYNIPIISNPEFLSARTAEEDFLHPTSIVAGHHDEGIRDRVQQFYAARFPDVPLLLYHSCREAELVKYARNTFFALKVAYMNQLYDLAASLEVPWESVKEGLLGSGWVNPMHTNVPGSDGSRGFGGACLPKDSRALLEFSWDQRMPLTILEAALSANKLLRQGE